MSQIEQVRGHRRLEALGVAPEDASGASLSALKDFYEAERARYIQLASSGLHLAPSHALYGMLVAAIKDAQGWDELPPDWSPEHPSWPHA